MYVFNCNSSDGLALQAQKLQEKNILPSHICQELMIDSLREAQTIS